MKKIILILTVLITALSVFSSCDKADNNTTDNQTNSSSAETSSQYPTVTLTVKEKGQIILELYPEKAPNTVANFINLADNGFYDELIFHRVIKGFMIQGGCPEGNGFGDPGYSIKGECAGNGFEQNDLKNNYGYIAMARSSVSYDTAGSQFYINVADNTSLDGEYTVFGKVISGMEIAEEISSVTTNSNDKPLKNIIIESIKTDCHGVNYGEPETIPN